LKTVKQPGAATEDGWDCATIEREQLGDNNMRQSLWEMEAGEHPKCKNTADHSPTNKGYRAQCILLVVRDGILEHHWESDDRRSKTAQIILPMSKVKQIMGELHGTSSGRHLGVNKTVDRVRQWYYWLHVRNGVERWCQQ
jgi:hypothetical protein